MRCYLHRPPLWRPRVRSPFDVDHEIARDRDRITLDRKQQLKNHVGAVKEFEFDGGKIEFPHPAESFVVDRRRLGSIFGEALAPMFYCVMIMQPQHFHVVAPQTATFSGGKGL